MQQLAPEVRPVIKVLAKEVTERTKLDDETLLGYFKKIKFFKEIQVSTSELVKNLN